MIDIKLIRADPDLFIHAAKVKNISVDINRLLEIDKQLLRLRQELQEIRTEQNKTGKNRTIGRTQGKGKGNITTD